MPNFGDGVDQLAADAAYTGGDQPERSGDRMVTRFGTARAGLTPSQSRWSEQGTGVLKIRLAQGPDWSLRNKEIDGAHENSGTGFLNRGPRPRCTYPRVTAVGPSSPKQSGYPRGLSNRSGERSWRESGEVMSTHRWRARLHVSATSRKWPGGSRGWGRWRGYSSGSCT